MYFPIYIDLSKKNILVVGAGRIAGRRIRTLCEFAGQITVVAPEVSEEIEYLSEKYPISVCQRRFDKDDLDDRFLVFAATDDHELNRYIGEECRKRGIPVNVCSDRNLCDFQFPSIVRKDGVVIGVNASGKDHSLVKETRQKLEQLLKPGESEKLYEDS